MTVVHQAETLNVAFETLLSRRFRWAVLISSASTFVIVFTQLLAYARVIGFENASAFDAFFAFYTTWAWIDYFRTRYRMRNKLFGNRPSEVVEVARYLARHA